MADKPIYIRKNPQLVPDLNQLQITNQTPLDCSLSAEGQYYNVHRVVLSAYSPYFANVLIQRYKEIHPVIFLDNLAYSDLEKIVEYMYLGEVSIPRSQAASFFNPAERLQLLGLRRRDLEASGSAKEDVWFSSCDKPRKSDEPNREEVALQTSKPVASGVLEYSPYSKERVQANTNMHGVGVLNTTNSDLDFQDQAIREDYLKSNKTQLSSNLPLSLYKRPGTYIAKPRQVSVGVQTSEPNISTGGRAQCPDCQVKLSPSFPQVHNSYFRCNNAYKSLAGERGSTVECNKCAALVTPDLAGLHVNYLCGVRPIKCVYCDVVLDEERSLKVDDLLSHVEKVHKKSVREVLADLVAMDKKTFLRKIKVENEIHRAEISFEDKPDQNCRLTSQGPTNSHHHKSDVSWKPADVLGVLGLAVVGNIIVNGKTNKQK